MRFRSFGAGTMGVALVAGSVFLGASPVNADTIIATVPNPVPVETSPYAAGWFAGDVASGDGFATQSAAGLTITGGANGYQLLNGDPAVATDITLAAAAGLGVSTAGGNAFYQISVFGEPNTQFTTLRPVDPTDLAGNWATSQAFGTYAANAEDTLAAFTIALDAGEPAQVLAFGVFVNAGTTVVVRAIGWNGDNYLFAAAPAATANPATVAESDVTAEVTVSGLGFAPGELVTVTTSGLAGVSSEVIEADADGNVVLVYTADTGAGSLEQGDYVFTFSDSSGLFAASTTFSVVADAVVAPAAPIAPAATLANTGIDAMTAVVAASVLFAAGGGLIMLSQRRKTALQL